MYKDNLFWHTIMISEEAYVEMFHSCNLPFHIPSATATLFPSS